MTGEADGSIYSNIAGYVLAGGLSSRFGGDKALAVLDGKPMLTRMCELLDAITTRVKIVAVDGKYDGSQYPIVADLWPGEGPLGGIITALRDNGEKKEGDGGSKPPQSRVERADGGQKEVWNLIVSCDMPFLTVEWLRFTAERAENSNADVVVPQSRHGLEPLCACWRTRAAETIQEAFLGGTRKVTDALKLLKTEVLDERDWKRFDSGGRLFWNMNTVADYEEARRILESREK